MWTPGIILGLDIQREGRLDEAMADYQKALQFNPDHANARNNLGLALIQKGRPDEAIEQFQMALQSQPRNTNSHLNLGTGLRKMGGWTRRFFIFKGAGT